MHAHTAIWLNCPPVPRPLVSPSSRSDYHKACILKWLKSNEVPSCPQCKAPALAGADSPVAGAPESSPEQQWWHT